MSTVGYCRLAFAGFFVRLATHKKGVKKRYEMWKTDGRAKKGRFCSTNCSTINLLGTGTCDERREAITRWREDRKQHDDHGHPERSLMYLHSSTFLN